MAGLTEVDRQRLLEGPGAGLISHRSLEPLPMSGGLQTR
jgi:hypothetical protein